MLDNPKSILVLETIKKSGLPVGASFLSKELTIPPATIGRILTDLEKHGYVSKISNKGRTINEKGLQYLSQVDLKKEQRKDTDQLLSLVTDAAKDNLLEILQVRKLLEAVTVEMACKNATDMEIMELEYLILEHIHLIRQKKLGSNLDLEIHLGIAKASGNQTIYQILKVLLTSDNVYTKFSYVSEHVTHTQIKQHDAIIQAIKERSPEKAKLAMEEHLDQVIEDVNNYYHEEDHEQV